MRLVKITCFLYHPEDSVDIYAGPVQKEQLV